jgi:F-type H+-transporting ATPase subunit beta
MPTNTSTLPAAETLLGRVIDPAGNLHGGDAAAPHDPRQPAAARAEIPATNDLHPSGIKVIDLYAPIVRGGVTTMTAAPGVGLVVVTTELIHNLATRQGGCAVLATAEDDMMALKELVADLRSAGVDQDMIVVSGLRNDASREQQPIADTAIRLAEELCAAGRETVLILYEPAMTPAAVARLQSRQRGDAALTTLIWQILTREQLEAEQLPDVPIASDGRLVFSRALGQQKIWPAVDSLRSSSRLLDARLASAEHLRVAAAGRDLLRATGVAEGTGDTSTPNYGRARRLLLFQGQPFAVAEPYTAVPGEYVPLADTIRAFGDLVAGKYDAVPEAAFQFVGPIEQALAKGGQATSR